MLCSNCNTASNHTAHSFLSLWKRHQWDWIYNCALVYIYRAGSIMLYHGGAEMGLGLHTKIIQVCHLQDTVYILQLILMSCSNEMKIHICTLYMRSSMLLSSICTIFEYIWYSYSSTMIFHLHFVLGYIHEVCGSMWLLII